MTMKTKLVLMVLALAIICICKHNISAQDKVNGLMFKLVLVTIAVSILIFWFLNWRAALVCFIVIPNGIATGREALQVMD